MSGYEKRSGNFAIRLLILLTICVFGRPAEARTSIYMFVPGQSTVIQTGGIAGVHETYGIEGKFRLTGGVQLRHCEQMLQHQCS
jgi:hypothetical protein